MVALDGEGITMATRTWVSGVGDDASPGQRTSPCKTFAGAISKTDAFGEIDALDPGGFGPVTITKSVTIDGGTGSGWASILAPGVTGIVINAQNGIVVLRRLSINGLGTGIAGIRILNADSVTIEDCHIFNFRAATGTDAGTGIRDARTNGGFLYVARTTIGQNSQSGIVITPSSGSLRTNAQIDQVRFYVNGSSGLFVGPVGLVTLSNSIFSNNVTSAVTVQESGGTTEVNIERCVMSQNGIGINAVVGASTTRLSESMIINNGAGISTAAGAVVASFGNNRIAGNGSANAPTAGAGIALQ